MVDMLAWDDRTLAGRKRAQRHERHDGVIVIDDARRAATGNDLTEGTGHGLPLWTGGYLARWTLATAFSS